MLKAIFLTGAVLGISTAQSISAEPTISTPTVFAWTGGYIGLQAGHAWGRSHYDVDVNVAYIPYDPDGWFGGTYAGYNHQLPNSVVIGIEGDLNLADVKAGRTILLSPRPVPSEYGDSRINWHGSVRGRLGYAFDRLLPYFAAGVAFARYDHSFNFDDRNVAFKENYAGWTAGAGLEYAATDKVLARIEYRYSDFGKENFGAVKIPFGEIFPHTTDLKTHDIRVGLAYKF